MKYNKDVFLKDCHCTWTNNYRTNTWIYASPPAL